MHETHHETIKQKFILTKWQRDRDIMYGNLLEQKLYENLFLPDCVTKKSESCFYPVCMSAFWKSFLYICNAFFFEWSRLISQECCEYLLEIVNWLYLFALVRSSRRFSRISVSLKLFRNDGVKFAENVIRRFGYIKCLLDLY